jgi:hypothetical protein
VSQILFESNIANEQRAELERQAMQQWIDRRTMPQEYIDSAAKVLEPAGRDFATLEGKIQPEIINIVDEALRTNLPIRELEKQLVEKYDGIKHRAKTAANTAKAGFQTINAFAGAERAGVNKFKYIGAQAQRPFCRKHLNKIYTKEEILKLDNGQGLPVWIYRGGYNCIHRWQVYVR